MAPQSPPDPSDPGRFEQDLKAYFEERKAQQRAPAALREKLKALPHSRSARETGDKMEPQPNEGWLWRLWWMPVPAAIIALVLAFVIQPSIPIMPQSQPHLAAKGTSWRVLYARPHSGSTKGMLAHELKPGQQLLAGDLIQFVYRTSQPIHVVIVGINQQGHIYPLVKTHAGQSVRLAKGNGVLPQRRGKARAFKLDRYVGQERFLIATATQPFPYTALRRALQKAWKKHPSLQALRQLPGPWQIDTILFHKAATSEPTKEP